MVDFGSMKDSLKGQFAGATEYFADLKEDGKEKFVAYINSIGDIIPIIAETGYRLEGLEIELSIPPGIAMRFQKFRSVSPEAIDAILEKNKDRDMLKTIVNALVAADQFHNKLKLGSLVFADVTLGLGLPPRVTMNFVKKGE